MKLTARYALLVVAGLVSVGAIAPTPPTGNLTVRVTNVRNARGQVHIDICPQAFFLQDNCPYAAFAPARSGVTTVTAHGIPAGSYAVQAFHDENGNHKVDRA